MKKQILALSKGLVPGVKNKTRVGWVFLVLFGAAFAWSQGQAQIKPTSISRGLKPPYLTDVFYGQFKEPPGPTVGSADLTALTTKIQDGRLRLTLDEAIALALRNNLNVQLQRLNVTDSNLAIPQTAAVFEPTWRQIFAASRDNQPTPNIFSSFEGVRDKRWLYSSSVSKYFETGTALSVDFSLGWTNNNNLMYLVNPGYTSNWSLGLTQHLLKGFGRAVNRAPVLVAENSAKIADEEFTLRLEQTISAVERLYWSILLAETDFSVKRDSLHLAEATRSDVAAQVEAGNQPELNLYKASAEVAFRRQEQIQAETAVKNLKQNLLQLISAEVETSATGVIDLILVPLDPEIEKIPLSYTQALERAWRERPEVSAAAAGLATSEVLLRSAHNRLKPALDLSASYTQYGLKGEIRDLSSLPFTVPSGTDILLRQHYGGGLLDSIGNAFGGLYNGVTVKATLTIPLGNMDARAGAVRAELARERQKITLEQVRQAIALEVSTVLNNLERDQAVIQAAVENRIQAEKNLEGEQAKYEAGVVVIRDLLEAQRNLAAARTQEISSRIGYQLSLIDYYLVTSQLLEKHHIDLVQARQ